MRPNSLNLLYEDKHLLVCVKPSGTATQSRSVKIGRASCRERV